MRPWPLISYRPLLSLSQQGEVQPEAPLSKALNIQTPIEADLSHWLRIQGYKRFLKKMLVAY